MNEDEAMTRTPDPDQVLTAILEDLSQPTRLSDMPRRIELCQQALSLVNREEDAYLWAALRFELGNSLVQTPKGDRADNIEKAIRSYEQTMEVVTRQVMPVE